MSDEPKENAVVPVDFKKKKRLKKMPKAKRAKAPDIPGAPLSTNAAAENPGENVVDITNVPIYIDRAYAVVIQRGARLVVSRFEPGDVVTFRPEPEEPGPNTDMGC